MPPVDTGKRWVASKRGAGKLSPLRIATNEKRATATSLRAAGYTFKQIAETLGVTPGRAHQLVDEALYATLAVPAESLRQIEQARLDELLTAVYSKALGGDHRAIGSALKIMDRIAKLNGLDTPGALAPNAPPTEDTTAFELKFIDGATGKEIKDFGKSRRGNRAIS